MWVICNAFYWCSQRQERHRELVLVIIFTLEHILISLWVVCKSLCGCVCVFVCVSCETERNSYNLNLCIPIYNVTHVYAYMYCVKQFPSGIIKVFKSCVLICCFTSCLDWCIWSLITTYVNIKTLRPVSYLHSRADWLNFMSNAKFETWSYVQYFCFMSSALGYCTTLTTLSLPLFTGYLHILQLFWVRYQSFVC